MGSPETAEALCPSGVAEAAPDNPQLKARARTRDRNCMASSSREEDILRPIPYWSKLQNSNVCETKVNSRIYRMIWWLEIMLCGEHQMNTQFMLVQQCIRDIVAADR